jgi:chromate transporter
VRLREIAGLFLRLGATAFGGPAAHIALMERAVVGERRWMDHGEFAGLLGAANLLPGPTSTELSILLGLQRGGAAGMLLAGISFILPSAVLTLALAWAYVHFGALPALTSVLAGLQPAVLGVVIGALSPLARSVARTPLAVVLAIAAALAGLLGVHPLAVLLAAGLLTAAISRPLPLLAPALPAIAWAFFKIGAILYGSGYLLVALARSELVAQRGWITERQLLDAVAAGQLTPGPVSSTATFIGYVLAGLPGAVVATVFVFLPSFLLVAAVAPLLDRVKTSPVLAAFLRGVSAASLGLIAAVVAQLGQKALTSPIAWAIGLGAAAGALFTKLNPSWFLLGGAAIGWLLA